MLLELILLPLLCHLQFRHQSGTTLPPEAYTYYSYSQHNNKMSSYTSRFVIKIFSFKVCHSTLLISVCQTTDGKAPSNWQWAELSGKRDNWLMTIQKET